MADRDELEIAASLARVNHLLQVTRAEWAQLGRLAGPEHPLMVELYHAALDLVPLHGPCELLGCMWLLEEVVREHVEGPSYVILCWPASLWRILADEVQADHPGLAARIRQALPGHREMVVEIECSLRDARLLRLVVGERG